MTVLVDEAVWPWRGRRWAHLVSDESYDELHAFADALGIPERAFQGDHYDVPADLRDKAVAAGAEAVSARELVVRLRAAGLRLSAAERRARREAEPPRRPNLRQDPLSGAWTVVNRDRQSRPNLPSRGCPFCPGGIEAPEPYEVRWFENRWPAMPGDRCEVVLYTPDHDATFASLGVDGALRVVDLWAARTAALGARPEIAYVLVFENRGPEVGATIAHPHGQIYAYDDVPAVPLAELERAGARDAGPCPLCVGGAARPPAELSVGAGEGWSAWTPAASAWPYELLVAPDAHRPDLPSLDAGERRALASILVDALGRLDRLFDAPMPYMLWVHQRPTDGGDWPQAHLHVHVAPVLRKPGTLRFVAGAEVGGGTYFNPVAPEDAAEALRAV